MIEKNFSKIMNKDEVERTLTDIDAKIYSLLSAYLNDCMEPDAAKKFEYWFTRRKLDTFNKTAKEKREFYEG
jgi:regulator of RNase E activity RraB